MANEPPKFEFSYSDIESYYQQYLNNEGQVINKKTFGWPYTTLEFFWACTNGVINEANLILYRNRALEYPSFDSQEKWFRYAHAFLTMLERKYNWNLSYFLDHVLSKRFIKGKETQPAPKVLDEDIKNAINHILNYPEHRKGIKESKEDYLIALLFLCYTGIRPDTPEKIPLKQLKVAIAATPPILPVNEDASQEKVSKTHYVPLHPDLVEHLTSYIESRQFTDENEPIIKKTTLYDFFRNHPLELVSKKGKRFTTNLPRKYFNQKSKALKLEQSILNHIVNRGEVDIESHHYLGEYLPEIIYNGYMEKWRNVHLIPKESDFIHIGEYWNQKKYDSYSYDQFLNLPDQEKILFLKGFRYKVNQKEDRLIPPIERIWMEYELTSNNLLLDYEISEDRIIEWRSEDLEEKFEQRVNDEFRRKYGDLEEAKKIILDNHSREL